ncbi:four-carbon acid sugar kinase family protein [Roseomonas elaeocarpi]|uniref:Four-carbon acid sugar kinase family protein n=1 Tax=Roseomonas elaeocarpi TaxID=907779 RepID=A0ABV6JWJ9_9PROT
MTPPFLGWYGDDFTGATDTLSALARRGIRALLFLGVPTPAQLSRAGTLEAVGIAGAARAMPPEAMRAALEPVGRFFAGLGVRVLHYKCCSTFDSAPEVGSLAVAMDTLRPAFPNRFLPVVGGQPGLGRYCLFGNLFAAASTGGEVYRLDRHPTMSRHPVTPMHEADLRRHLAAQGMGRVASLSFPAYALPAGELDARLAALLREAPEAVLLDVSREEDLVPIGRLLRARALAAPLLALGPSSVAEALAEAWPGEHQSVAAQRVPAQPEMAQLGAAHPGVAQSRAAQSGAAQSGAAQAAAAPSAPARSPVFVMVGSLSPVTRAQLEASPSYEHFRIGAAALAGDDAAMRALLEAVVSRLRNGRHVMVATERPAATDRLGPLDVARATARFLRLLMAEAPVRRLGIAGGDTSSLGAQALEFWGLSYLDMLAPGVVLCRGHSDDPRLDGVELMLKGGQMGPPDLFERFAA